MMQRVLLVKFQDKLTDTDKMDIKDVDNKEDQTKINDRLIDYKSRSKMENVC